MPRKFLCPSPKAARTKEDWAWDCQSPVAASRQTTAICAFRTGLAWAVFLPLICLAVRRTNVWGKRVSNEWFAFYQFALDCVGCRSRSRLRIRQGPNSAATLCPQIGFQLLHFRNRTGSDDDHRYCPQPHWTAPGQNVPRTSRFAETQLTK